MLPGPTDQPSVQHPNSVDVAARGRHLAPLPHGKKLHAPHAAPPLPIPLHKEGAAGLIHSILTE